MYNEKNGKIAYVKPNYIEEMYMFVRIKKNTKFNGDYIK